MKTWGIVLIVFGSLSLLGAILSTANGRTGSAGGLAFVVLGIYLIHRAKQKKEEEDEFKKWNKS